MNQDVYVKNKHLLYLFSQLLSYVISHGSVNASRNRADTINPVNIQG